MYEVKGLQNSALLSSISKLINTVHLQYEIEIFLDVLRILFLLYNENIDIIDYILHVNIIDLFKTDNNDDVFKQKLICSICDNNSQSSTVIKFLHFILDNDFFPVEYDNVLNSIINRGYYHVAVKISNVYQDLKVFSRLLENLNSTIFYEIKNENELVDSIKKFIISFDIFDKEKESTIVKVLCTYSSSIFVTSSISNYDKLFNKVYKDFFSLLIHRIQFHVRWNRKNNNVKVLSSDSLRNITLELLKHPSESSLVSFALSAENDRRIDFEYALELTKNIKNRVIFKKVRNDVLNHINLYCTKQDKEKIAYHYYLDAIKNECCWFLHQIFLSDTCFYFSFSCLHEMTHLLEIYAKYADVDMNKKVLNALMDVGIDVNNYSLQLSLCNRNRNVFMVYYNCPYVGLYTSKNDFIYTICSIHKRKLIRNSGNRPELFIEIKEAIHEFFYFGQKNDIYTVVKEDLIVDDECILWYARLLGLETLFTFCLQEEIGKPLIPLLQVDKRMILGEKNKNRFNLTLKILIEKNIHLGEFDHMYNIKNHKDNLILKKLLDLSYKKWNLNAFQMLIDIDPDPYLVLDVFEGMRGFARQKYVKKMIKFFINQSFEVIKHLAKSIACLENIFKYFENFDQDNEVVYFIHKIIIPCIPSVLSQHFLSFVNHSSNEEICFLLFERFNIGTEELFQLFQIPSRERYHHLDIKSIRVLLKTMIRKEMDVFSFFLQFRQIKSFKWMIDMVDICVYKRDEFGLNIVRIFIEKKWEENSELFQKLKKSKDDETSNTNKDNTMFLPLIKSLPKHVLYIITRDFLIG